MHRLLFAHAPKWADLAISLDELMATGAFNLHKNEGRVRAGLLKLDISATVFIKRAEARSRGHALYEAMTGSRARRALAGAAILKSAGFAHPTPLAVVEDRGRLGAVRASYLVSEALVEARTFSVFALGRNGELRRDMGRRLSISHAVGREVRRLHDAGLFTRDLQETNLMLEDGPGGLKIYFIDLEDLRKARRVSERRRLMNLVHLDRSIGRFIGRAGRLRFLYSYIGKRLNRDEVRRLVTRILRMRNGLDRRGVRRDNRNRETSANVRRPVVEG